MYSISTEARRRELSFDWTITGACEWMKRMSQTESSHTLAVWSALSIRPSAEISQKHNLLLISPPHNHHFVMNSCYLTQPPSRSCDPYTQVLRYHFSTHSVSPCSSWRPKNTLALEHSIIQQVISYQLTRLSQPELSAEEAAASPLLCSSQVHSTASRSGSSNKFLRFISSALSCNSGNLLQEVDLPSSPRRVRATTTIPEFLERNIAENFISFNSFFVSLMIIEDLLRLGLPPKELKANIQMYFLVGIVLAEKTFAQTDGHISNVDYYECFFHDEGFTLDQFNFTERQILKLLKFDLFKYQEDIGSYHAKLQQEVYGLALPEKRKLSRRDSV